MIKRLEENNQRWYVTDRKGRNIKARNVTSFIDAFTDKTWLERWYMSLGRQNLGDEAHEMSDDEILAEGKEQAQAHTLRAANAGTESHNVVEKYVLEKRGIQYDEWVEKHKLSPNLYTFFKHVHEFDINGSPSVETKLIYVEDEHFALGGTTDLVCNLDIEQLSFYKNEQNTFPLKRKGHTVVDYKFPNKAKYKKDVINYCIQLAIYKYGLNQTYSECNVVDGLIVVSPRATEMLYLYYLDEQRIDYYFNESKDMMYLYRHGLSEVYDWLDFVKKCEEDNMLPYRLCI